MNYAIPINIVKKFLHCLPTYEGKATRVSHPMFGAMCQTSSEEHTQYLGNPAPGGYYVNHIVPGSQSDNNGKGLRAGDQIFQVDTHTVTPEGSTDVPWADTPISVTQYLSREDVGDTVTFKVYRNGGEEVTVDIPLTDVNPFQVKPIHPPYSEFEYVVVGDMVIQQLTQNHVQGLLQANAFLAKYLSPDELCKPSLIVTDIFAGGLAQRAHCFGIGSLIDTVNGRKVRSIKELKAVFQNSTDEFFSFTTDMRRHLTLSKEQLHTSNPETKDNIYNAPKSDMVNSMSATTIRNVYWEQLPLGDRVADAGHNGVAIDATSRTDGGTTPPPSHGLQRQESWRETSAPSYLADPVRREETARTRTDGASAETSNAELDTMADKIQELTATIASLHATSESDESAHPIAAPTERHHDQGQAPHLLPTPVFASVEDVLDDDNVSDSVSVPESPPSSGATLETFGGSTGILSSPDDEEHGGLGEVSGTDPVTDVWNGIMDDDAIASDVNATEADVASLEEDVPQPGVNEEGGVGTGEADVSDVVADQDHAPEFLHFADFLEDTGTSATAQAAQERSYGGSTSLSLTREADMLVDPLGLRQSGASVL